MVKDLSRRIAWLLLLAAWPTPGLARDAVAQAAVLAGEPAGAHASATGISPRELSLRRANFLGEVPSPEALRMANWAISSGDSGGLPFIVVDKISARVFVFDAGGLLRGASMVLLGFAPGDDTAPGIGTRKLLDIRPEERTTPAGRFVATLGRDLQQDILWIDYEAALSLHRVVVGNPTDRRLQRLIGRSPLNKRITYGCINVPANFFDNVILTVVSGAGGIVYILPEQRRLDDVFDFQAPGSRSKPRP